MAGQPLRTPSGEGAEQPWRSSLDALEAALAEAARAITELRFSLEEENTASAGPVAVPDPAANERSERLTDFERVWQRLESKRKEPSAALSTQDDLSKPSGLSEPSDPHAARAEQDDLSKPSGPSEPSDPRGLDLLPSSYLMTIEDRDASVDLITLQRGLLTLAPMEDIRLVTYAKGVPVISLRSEGELDLQRLGEAIGNATGRRCEVIPQDGTKLFLRLTPNDDQEEEAA